jgi:hypothetical protein
MCVRAIAMVFIVSILVTLIGTTAVHAQGAAGETSYRNGFWIGFGVGATYAQIDCSTCGPLLPDDPWEGGLGSGWYLAMGSGLSANLLLGGELNLYGKRNSSLQRDATLGSLAVVLQYYPLAASGFYLKSGAGFGGSIMAGGPGLIESGGWATQVGVGYDLPIGRRFAVGPFANLVYVFSEGSVGNNQAVPAQGPRNPRYGQLGLGFHWY